MASQGYLRKNGSRGLGAAKGRHEGLQQLQRHQRAQNGISSMEGSGRELSGKLINVERGSGQYRGMSENGASSKKNCLPELNMDSHGF
jgi:hypothetical protein